MSTRPTRETTAGRTYLDLQNMARRQRRPTDELHQLYALECFLARLAASRYVDDFVLKGGVLLAAFDNRRPTRDIDLLGFNVSNEVEDVVAMMREVALIKIDDGLTLRMDGITGEAIREDEAYSGVRVTINGTLARARVGFHVDINVGDPVWPEPQPINLPRLLAGQITLRGYPLHMVHAEKLVTAVDRGAANTRWRDFADVYMLSRRHNVGGDHLQEALNRVANHRGVVLVPLRQALGDLPVAGQTRWAAWRRRQAWEAHLPELLTGVVNQMCEFVDPVTSGVVGGLSWSAADQRWDHDTATRTV